MRVKIIGAGSAGIHLAQACSRMGWEVWICDNSSQALERVYGVYASRYGKWDDEIHICDASVKFDGFDIIMIATPPDVRMELALGAIKENPKLLHLEKPLCTPDLKGVTEFEAEMKNHLNTIVTVGYDHAVSKSIRRVAYLLNENRIEERSGAGGEFGKIPTIDVEFREHWEGIFKAHTWLKGPHESYLGYWERGGGAGNEHSHALHLFLKLAEYAWWWKDNNFGIQLAQSVMSKISGSKSEEYDETAHFMLLMNDGKVGRVTQDVVTKPPRKWARIQGTKGWIEWHCNGDPAGDVVKYETESQRVVEIFPKTRPDDFYAEIKHYAILLDGEKHCESPLSYRSGLEVMKILNKAYYG